MNEKKKLDSWIIAGIHWLLVTLYAFVVLFGVLLTIATLFTLFGLPSEGIESSVWFNFVLWPIIFGMGVMFSAKNINKKYIVADSVKIVNLASIYFIVSDVLNLVYTISVSGFLAKDAIGVVISIVVFYFVSKKYILTTNQAV